MPNLLVQRLSVVIVAFSLSATAEANAEERTAADILPPTTLAFAEIRQPVELLRIIYDHELAGRLMALDSVRAAMEKKAYLDFKALVAIIESQMGLPWRQIVGQATGGGIAIAVDAKTNGVVILAQATDGATHSKLVETLVKLATVDAKNKGNADPVETSDYRGVNVYAVENIKIAAASDWLAVTNNAELGKQVLDRILDRSDDSLAGDAQFANVHGAVSPSTTVWGYVNTAALREAGVATKLFEDRADNPLAEIILGGILSTLRQTPYVTVDLAVSNRGMRLSASAPHDRAWAGELREYYFGPQGMGAAPPRLLAHDAILSVSAYRDISAMWLRAGDLLDEQANEEVAKADSGLSTLFSGKDFGEDILGSFGPEVRVVVVRQEFAEGQPAPAIKLPAFGLVADLKDPAKMQPELRRTFQNLVGFFNVVGAMNGQPQLELATEKSDSTDLVTASHLSDTDADDPLRLRINYNFSPSIAFANGRFALTTTRTLAHAVATADATREQPGDAQRVVNTDAVLHFDALREVFADNREQLIAQNMIEEGHSRDEAEQAIGVLLELVAWFDELALRLDTTPSQLQATLELSLNLAN